MNNDLISREALKKWIDESVRLYGNQYSTDMLNMFGLFREIIDNAPTVEQKYYERIIAQINPVIDERPQGEWNYIQADMCVCPFCGAMPHKLYKNYCAKCGARMGGTT